MDKFEPPDRLYRRLYTRKEKIDMLYTNKTIEQNKIMEVYVFESCNFC